MSDMYAVKDTTLTALGDAVRKHTGKYISIDEKPEPFFVASGIHTDLEMIGYDSSANRNYYLYTPSIDFKNIPKADMATSWYVEYTLVNSNEVSGPLSTYIQFSTLNSTTFLDKSNLICVIDVGPTASKSGNKTIKILDRWTNGYLLIGLRPDEDNQGQAVSFDIKIWALDANNQYIDFNKYTPLEMADAINSLKVPNIQPIVLTGNCSYACSGVLASQFIDEYGDKISTKDITSVSSMFYGGQCEVIPFEINCKSGTAIDMTSMFNNNAKLQRLPKINNAMPSGMQHFFSNCNYLPEVPEDYGADWDWSKIDNATSGYSGNRANTFAYCGGLRKLPMKFLEHGNPVCNYNYSIYNCLAEYCYVLDEIVGLPIPHAQAGWTSNAFSYAFDQCYRAQRLTFKTAEDGSPVVVNWKNQVINLTNYFGYASSYNFSNITRYSDITADKRVKDDATYQALKNDPDWFTGDVNYSRYNHDSAVETINSLPDCSATGINTIKFRGEAGSLTDGGAINTLTEEEIAVASSKGWSVAFV